MKEKHSRCSCLLLLLATLLLFTSCKKENNETLISKNGQNESHQQGNNCMKCHTSGGKGEGYFVVAGTVYSLNLQATLPNGLILFFSGPNGSGTLLKTIETDQLGNFYSTEDFDFSAGVYTAAAGNDTTIYMNARVTTGQCNSCHGQSTEMIYSN